MTSNSLSFTDKISAEKVAQDMNIQEGKTMYTIARQNNKWVIVEIKGAGRGLGTKTATSNNANAQADAILKAKQRAAAKEALEKTSFTVKDQASYEKARDVLKDRGIHTTATTLQSGKIKVTATDELGNKVKFRDWDIERISGDIADKRTEQEERIKKASQEVIDKKVEKESKEREKLYKAAEGMAASDKDSANQIKKALDEKGYLTDIHIDPQTGYYMVSAFNKNTGEPMLLTQDDIMNAVEKYKGARKSYKQLSKEAALKQKQSIKESLTPTMIRKRTMQLGANIAKDETTKTLKVTSEHADIIGAMINSIPKTKGEHPRISGVDDNGIQRQPKIMSLPKMHGTEQGFDRRFVINPNPKADRKTAAEMLDEE